MEATRKLKQILKDGHLGWLSALWQCSQFGSAPLEAPPTAPAALLSEEGELVYDLFFRGVAVDRQQASRALGEVCLSHFIALGLLAGTGEILRTTGLRLRSELGFHLFAGYIPASSGKAEVSVHFGYDSLMLAQLIQYQSPVRRALDLCAGGGIQALCLARLAEHVTAVEYVPAVAEVARINISLAGRENQIEINTGDLFAGAGHGTFDLIVCNPPFAPSFEQPCRDPVGAGGLDGLDVVRAIWREAPRHLSNNGRIFIIAGMFGDANGPFAEEEIRSVSQDNRWDVRVLEIREPMPIDRFQISSIISEDQQRRVQQLSDAARVLAVTHYHMGIIMASPSPSPRYERTRLYSARASQMQTAIRELRRNRQHV